MIRIRVELLHNMFYMYNCESNSILEIVVYHNPQIFLATCLAKESNNSEVYVSNDELILLDLIRCIVLTFIKQESLKPMDIDYFCPDGIIIGEDYLEHFISITKAFLNLNDLIGKEDREYVMYIHSLFTFYGLSYHINKYYSEILTDDLVRQGSFWIDFNNIMNGVEQVIQGMEMNYPGDNSDKTPSN